MNNSKQIFFELLQAAIGNGNKLTVVPTPQEWQAVYELSKRHALAGIAFIGVRKLFPNGCETASGMFMRRWASTAERVKDHNDQTTLYGEKVLKHFREAGFKAVLLKGASNHRYYGEELAPYRAPGDVDVWVRGTSDNPVREVIEYCVKHMDKEMPKEIYYHHMDYSLGARIPIEVHYRPSWLNSPIKNRRLQRYFIETAERGTLFDALTQLSHLYKHLFEEGMGLKQIVDLYFVCKALTAKERKELCHFIDETGMRRFAASMMYVMQRVLKMPEEMMLMPADSKYGEQLLSEIMMAGNFGRYDKRMKHYDSGTVGFAWEKLKRNMRFLTAYPEEVICEPFFRLYHWMWRKHVKLRIEN